MIVLTDEQREDVKKRARSRLSRAGLAEPALFGSRADGLRNRGTGAPKRLGTSR